MRPPTEGLLRELAAHDAALCVSLFLEVARGGGEHDQIRIALKTAKEAADAAIRRARADPDAAAGVRERLDALRYEDVRGGGDRRVAVFIAPDMTEIVDARSVETGVHAGRRFRLAPLLDGLDVTPEHAVLVATRDEARLLRATGGALLRQEVRDMPGSLEEVGRFTDMQEKGAIHGREDSGAPGSRGGSAGGSGPVGTPHHSMGGHDWREDHEHDLRGYANLLANAAQRHLDGTGLPLVVAADERLHGMIRENCDYPFLVEEGVALHPKALDDDALRQEAAACVERAVEQRRSAAWNRVAMSLGRGDREASEDPAEIATAAAAGRLSHLIVRANATAPGAFDEASLGAKAVEDGPDDLVDLAIAGTLRNGGDVIPMDRRGRDGLPMAAAFRYPA